MPFNKALLVERFPEQHMPPHMLREGLPDEPSYFKAKTLKAAIMRVGKLLTGHFI